jgi:hypothetical protein
MVLNKRISFVLFLVLLVGLNSCRRSLESPNWDVNILSPVVYTTLTLDDLLPDSLTQVNPDSSITLVFDNTVYRFALDTLIDVPDTTILSTYTTPQIGLQIAPGATVFSNSDEFEYNVGDVELLEMKVRGGFINVSMTSSVPEDIVVTYTLTSSGFGDAGGQPLQMITTVPAATNGTTTIQTSTDISGYWFDLTGPSQNKFNTFTTSVLVQNAITSDTLNVQGGLSINLENSFVDIVPSYARGYFGQRIVEVPFSTSNFDGFSSIVSGSVDIDQVDVVLELINGVGIDLQASITALTAINNTSGQSVSLNHSVVGSTINMNRAEDLNGWIDVQRYTADLNNGNSNIDQFFEVLPDELGYALGLALNPFGNVSNGNDFIYYESEMAVNMNIELPLCLIASDLTLVDTLTIAVSDTLYSGRINSGVFTIFAENGFPFSADVQLYILDGNGNVLDSLFSNNTVLPATVNTSNYVIGETSSILYLDLPADKADLLYSSNTLLLKTRFNTVDAANGHTKLYDHYKLDIKLVADFEYNIDLNNE